MAPDTGQLYAVGHGRGVLKYEPTALLTGASVRGFVGSGSEVLILGFTIPGDKPMEVTIIGYGPWLADRSLPNALVDPELIVFSGPTPIAHNDNWVDSDKAGIIANSRFPPVSHLEPAPALTLPPGNYTAHLRGRNGTTGIGLIGVDPVHKDDSDIQEVIGVSVRGRAGTGDQTLILGFTVTGDLPVLVRGYGPSLSSHGLAAEQDPSLFLFSGSKHVASNANWQDAPSSKAIAESTFRPDYPNEPAVLLDLQPGNYTAHLRDGDGTANLGLIDVASLDR